MLGIERLDAPGKVISELKIGDMFTLQGEYIPDKTEVYTVIVLFDGYNDDMYAQARSNTGWYRVFGKNEIVYPV